jgi:hypothetical protein
MLISEYSSSIKPHTGLIFVLVNALIITWSVVEESKRISID